MALVSKVMALAALSSLYLSDLKTSNLNSNGFYESKLPSSKNIEYKADKFIREEEFDVSNYISEPEFETTIWRHRDGNNFSCKDQNTYFPINKVARSSTRKEMYSGIRMP